MKSDLSVLIAKNEFIPFFGENEIQMATWPEPQRGILLDLMDAFNYACENLPIGYVMTFSTDEDETWLIVHRLPDQALDLDEEMMGIFESLELFDKIIWATDLAIEDEKEKGVIIDLFKLQ